MEGLFDALHGGDPGSGILVGVAIWIATFLLASAVVMLLWNGLLPRLFRSPRVRFLQAAGLTLLMWILTGGGPIVRLSLSF